MRGRRLLRRERDALRRAVVDVDGVDRDDPDEQHRLGRHEELARRARSAAAAYIVKSGDTLSSIAIKTGVSLARIQALNPKLDSQSLQTGQRVKLSP